MIRSRVFHGPKRTNGALFALYLAAFVAFASPVEGQPTLWAWGGNARGQLGDGTTQWRTAPAPVKGPNGHGFLSHLTAITGGSEHALALSNDGTVWGWGDNQYEQTGGSEPAPLAYRDLPVKVAGLNRIGVLTDIVEVACGYYHSLARKADGSVWGWGRNYYGETGGNTTPAGRAYLAQVVGPGGVGTLTGVAGLAGGRYHSLAIKSDGTVWAWGRNEYGQLGNDTRTNSLTPVQVKGEGGNGYLTAVVTADAGYSFNTVLRADGTVWTWGYNRDGQLGVGSVPLLTTPQQVKGPGGFGYLTDVVDIAVGNTICFAVKSDGTVWGWGNGLYGVLGNGGTANSPYPVQVKGADGIGFLTDILMVTIAGSSCFALQSDGTVWGWGTNYYGELDTTRMPHTTPVRINGLVNPVILTGKAASYVIQSEGAIQGRITLENRLCIGIPIRFEFRPVQGGDSIVRTVPLAQTGTFTFFDIPLGTYNVAVKGSKWLQRVVLNVDTSSGGNILNLHINLRGGDADDNNVVDVNDLALLIQSFDADPASENWLNGVADFNYDNLVSVDDLSILIRNFDTAGEEL